MIEMTERPLCPDPEALGMFAEGIASEQEIAKIREHLATCNDCLDEVGEVTRAAQESLIVLDPSNVVPIRPGGTSRRGGWLAAAAALVVVAGGAGVWRTVIWDPANALRRSLPDETRVIEPRLYRFPYRAYSPKRGPADTENLKLENAAYSIIQDTSDHSSVKQRHADAVAKLLLWQRPEGEGMQNVRQAVSELTALVKENPKDARLQSDLAAALYWAAERNLATKEEALQAADRALQLDPTLREALFNRALILDRMDRPEKTAAWERFLETESDQDWINHVRERYLSQPTE